MLNVTPHVGSESNIEKLDGLSETKCFDFDHHTALLRDHERYPIESCGEARVLAVNYIFQQGQVIVQINS